MNNPVRNTKTHPFVWSWKGIPATMADLKAEVASGWGPIVEKCANDLLALGWDGTITQVKEKFGGLRFYAENVPEGGYDIIDAAEAASVKACELCGKPGAINTDGWMLTLCSECVVEQGREPNDPDSIDIEGSNW